MIAHGRHGILQIGLSLKTVSQTVPSRSFEKDQYGSYIWQNEKDGGDSCCIAHAI